MRIPRIYQPTSLSVNQTIVLDERAMHYVGRVLRKKINDPILLFNGQGGEYAAHIIQMTAKQVQLTIDTFIEIERESPLFIHLGQGLSRGEKMDDTIQKAVELGVSAITPLWTERSDAPLSTDRLKKRMMHWQGIIVSAAEQSGRTRLPILNTPQSLSDWLTQNTAIHRIVLSPHAKKNVFFPKDVCDISVLVGAEGGFTIDELTQAMQHDFVPCVLGPRILRTETAASTLIALLQFQLGDFSNNFSKNIL